MRIFTRDDLTRAVVITSTLMDENKFRLIELDSQIGDADLGLTMSKGFAAAKTCALELEDDDISTSFKKIGLAIAKAAPSTMGSLMATAFIGVGKEIGQKEYLDFSDVGLMYMSMARSIQERGKAKEGDKTLLDVLFPFARAVQSSRSQDICELMEIAHKVSKESIERTKNLMSQHGKAAVFREKTIGLEDPGGAAAVLLIEGFYRACIGDE